MKARSSGDLAQIDTYRQQFEAFYDTVASSNNAVADTTLKRSMKLSLYPNAGVVAGGGGTATLTLQRPPSGDMTVQFQAPNGNAQLPASVKIPAGASSVSLALSGLKAGVEEVLATPGDHQVATSAGPLPAPITVGSATLSVTTPSGARASDTINVVPVQPVYSGLAPGTAGLYQVNVQVPAGIAPGVQPRLMSVDLAHSNPVNIAVQ